MSPDNKTTRALGAIPTPDAQILTVDEVAAKLKITRGGIYELTRFRQDAGTPRLPARKVGRSLRFVAAEIDEWLLALPQHRHLQKRRYIKKDAPVKATRKRIKVAA